MRKAYINSGYVQSCFLDNIYSLKERSCIDVNILMELVNGIKYDSGYDRSRAWCLTKCTMSVQQYNNYLIENDLHAIKWSIELFVVINIVCAPRACVRLSLRIRCNVALLWDLRWKFRNFFQRGISPLIKVNQALYGIEEVGDSVLVGDTL